MVRDRRGDERNKHFHSFFVFPFCIKSVITSFSMTKKGSETHWGKFSHFLFKDPPAPHLLSYEGRVSKKKKWGKKRKGKKQQTSPLQSANEDSRTATGKGGRGKRGKERAIFSSSSSHEVRSSRGWGRERGRRYICVCFQFSLSCVFANPICVYQSRASVKSNIVLRWFWSSPESFNTLWFVRWKRHFTRILGRFSHKVYGWKGRFLFESGTLVISLLLSAIFSCHFTTCLFFVVYPEFYSLRGFIETICRPYSTLTNSDIIVLDRTFLYPGLMAVTL